MSLIQKSIRNTVLIALSIVGSLGLSTANAQGHNYIVPEAPAGTKIDGRQIIASTDVGLDQKLGEKIPLDIPFKDEYGKDVKIGDYFNKKQAVIFNLIFYRCPGVCTLELDGMARAFTKMRLKVGEDYQVVTLSINPKEGANLAMDKKKVYTDFLKQPGSENGWHFLTGTHENIQKLAGAIGYRYAFDLQKEQFAHPAGLTLLTPDGTISRYFYGSNFKPRDLQLGLVETSENKIGTVVDQVLLKCLHYDAITGKYTVAVYNILKIAATITILGVIAFWWIMARWDKNQKQQSGLPPTGGRPAAPGTAS